MKGDSMTGQVRVQNQCDSARSKNSKVTVLQPLLVMLMPSHSHRLTFGDIIFYLTIDSR